MAYGKVRRLQTAVCLLAAALILWGCKSGTDSLRITDTKKDTIELTVAWWGGSARTQSTRRALDMYEKQHPEIHFEILPMEWDDYFDNLSMRAASGQMPDIVQMDAMYLPGFTANQSLADLSEYIEDGTIDVSRIDEKLLETGKISGQMSGIVLASLIWAMGCNEEVFAEAGIGLPEEDWTWDDFKDICTGIHDRTGKYGFGMILADDVVPFQYYVRQHGYELFDETGQKLGYPDDRVYVEFVSMLKELSDAGAMPEPDVYDGIRDRGYEGYLIAENQAGLVMDWANLSTRLQTVNRNICLVTPPAGEKEGALWLKPSMFFSVAADSPYKKEAAAFINWFVNSLAANEVLLAERGMPVNEKVCQRLEESGLLSTQQEEMFTYMRKVEGQCGDEPSASTVDMAQINSLFHSTVYSVLYGSTTPQEAAAVFREEVERVLRE